LNSPTSFFDLFSPADVPPPARVSAPKQASELTRQHLDEGHPEFWKFHVKPREALSNDTTGALVADGRTIAAAYAAAVSFADAQFGRVIERLHQVKADESTVVLVMADHGWKLGHFGSWGKRTLMTQDTHVPLMISVPQWRRGHFDAPCELVDVYPTLLELAGVTVDYSKLHGRSLLPALRDVDAKSQHRKWSSEAFAISQWPIGIAWGDTEPPCMGYALRVANWTYVQWVHTPVRCSHGKCEGPLRETAEDGAAWAKLRWFYERGAGRGDTLLQPDRCNKHADLFRTPSDYGVTPDLEPEVDNVIDLYPQVATHLRELLCTKLKLNWSHDPSSPRPALREHLKIAWLHIPQTGASFGNALTHLANSSLPKHATISTDAKIFSQRFPLDVWFKGVFWEKDTNFGNHFSINDEVWQNFNGNFFGMFRNPAERAASAYKTFGETWDCEKEEADCAHEYAVRIRGGMAGMLAGQTYGLGCLSAKFKCEVFEPNVSLAISRLNGFAFIGLTEEWAFSICQFHALFGGECLPAEFADTSNFANTKPAGHYDYDGGPGKQQLNETVAPSSSGARAWAGYEDVTDWEVYTAAARIFWSNIRMLQLDAERCRRICPQVPPEIFRSDGFPMLQRTHSPRHRAHPQQTSRSGSGKGQRESTAKALGQAEAKAKERKHAARMEHAHTATP
jgi:hypothetical protein